MSARAHNHRAYPHQDPSEGEPCWCHYDDTELAKQGRCVKCGSDVVTLDFVASGHVSVPEYLGVTCTRCGYRWTRPCLDAKKKA